MKNRFKKWDNNLKLGNRKINKKDYNLKGKKNNSFIRTRKKHKNMPSYSNKSCNKTKSFKSKGNKKSKKKLRKLKFAKNSYNSKNKLLSNKRKNNKQKSKNKEGLLGLIIKERFNKIKISFLKKYNKSKRFFRMLNKLECTRWNKKKIKKW